MAYLSETITRYQDILDEKKDSEIEWILEKHKDPAFPQEHRPEMKPELRLYMRLVKQEARKRGLLRT